ncbi:hypothetical protein [Streptomyces sp. NPDC087859]|uniref:phosphorylase family protein n=1 Tax=Streptomyces sp. NPDC087859 TaxID=3365812 RepID=UPI0037F790AB
MAADHVRRPTAVILTALPLEYEAVRAHLTEVEKLVHQPTGTRAERGRLAGTPWCVALAEIGEGTLTAAAITERFNTWLKPEVLFLVGVAGGLKDDIKVGDVVVATKVYGIHGGKQTPEGFLVRPEAWHSSYRLEQAARHALRGKAHFKPIAVGDVVLADAESAIARHLHEHYNDAVAIEMESAGVAHAAHLTGKLDTLIIRGISDKADTQKHERDAEGSQREAARNAAAAAIGVLQDLEPTTESPDDVRLRDYLKAARNAAQRHPYPLVINISEEKRRLPAVYQGQQAILQHTPAAGDEQSGALGPDTGRSPAEEILAGEQTTVVISGPGGGKSSLLRTRLANGAESWLTGPGEDVVPVLVRATALVGPLSEALAAAVKTELAGENLRASLPPAFFATPPRPDVRWLVLVDGLDEIPDADTRRQILRRIADTAKDPHADLYRFAVATRPLPDGELDILGPEVPRYDLQPFNRDDMQQVAARWFDLFQLPDATEKAHQYIEALAQARLTELARIPLMASVLCQLHAANPRKPLPKDRTGAYEEFVTLIYEQNAHKEVKNIHDRAITALTESFQIPSERAAVKAAAVQVQDRLPELIEYLAYRRPTGVAGTGLPFEILAEQPALLAHLRRIRIADLAVEVLAEHPLAHRPTKVDREDWNRFLGMLLRATGLVTEVAGDFFFLHQTFREYLAARYAARDSRAAARALHRHFHQPLRDDSLLTRSPSVSLRLRLGRHWNPPRQSWSYVGFFIDAVLPNPELSRLCTRYLARLASPRAGPSGYAFLGEQVQLRTRLPEEVLRAAGDHLHALATDNTSSGGLRVQGAEQLARLDDPRGRALLHALATDTTLRSDDRMRATEALARQGDARTADLYASLVTDTTLDDYERVRAAEALVELDAPRATDLCASLAIDSGFRSDLRVRATEALAGLGDSRAPDLLHTLATDTTLGGARVLAAEALARLGDSRAPDLLHTLATDTTLRSDDRMRATEALARQGDARTADLYALLVTDTTLDDYERVRAAKALAELNDPRVRDLYASLATDTTLDNDYRVRAAEALVGLGDSRAPDLLHTSATDTTLDGARVLAAEALARLGDSRAPDLLHTLATDTTLDGARRMMAAAKLARLGDPRASGLLHTLATDTTFEFHQWAVLELRVLGDPRAAELDKQIVSQRSRRRRGKIS